MADNHSESCSARELQHRSIRQFFHFACFQFSDADNAVASPENGKKSQPDETPSDSEPGATGSDGPTIAKIEDVITLDPECDVLDLNHARIGKIEHLEGMVKLERLFMRWNLLKKIENLSTLTGLVELEFYDNQITEIENLDALVNLE